MLLHQSNPCGAATTTSRASKTTWPLTTTVSPSSPLSYFSWLLPVFSHSFATWATKRRSTRETTHSTSNTSSTRSIRRRRRTKTSLLEKLNGLLELTSRHTPAPETFSYHFNSLIFKVHFSFLLKPIRYFQFELYFDDMNQILCRMSSTSFFFNIGISSTAHSIYFFRAHTKNKNSFKSISFSDVE